MAVPLPAAHRPRRPGFVGRCCVGQDRVRFAELRERDGAGDLVAAGFFVVVGVQSQVVSRSRSASASTTASRGIARNSLLPFEGAAVGGSGLPGGEWRLWLRAR